MADRTWLAAALVAALVAAAGCAIPIRAERVDARRVHRQLTSNVLTTGHLSQSTQNVLYNSDLVAQYEDDPRGALAAAHAALAAGTLQPDELAALAELAFHHAEHGGGRPYFLASALYAWAYLFPEDERATPDAFDPRFRLACDLYNRGVTAGLMAADGKTVEVGPATLALPFGVLDVAFDPARVRWRDYTLVDFVPIAELEVVGLPTVHRWPGLGAPLAAGIASDTPVKDDLLAPRARYPVTALLRFPDVHEQLRGDRIQSTLEVYPAFGEQSVTIDGRPVPLEAEPTAALALSLDNPALWARERTGFLRGMGVIPEETRRRAPTHQQGASRWSWCTARRRAPAAGPRSTMSWSTTPASIAATSSGIFSYETGNPIAYSAMLLRESLEHAVARVDPQGQDPALRQMVIIGHSQGGLLTKAMVVEPGTALLEQHFPRADREARRRKTRHETSCGARCCSILAFRAARRVHRHAASRQLRGRQPARPPGGAPGELSLDVTNVFADVVVRNQKAIAAGVFQKGMPSSVDNMTPGNPFVKTMAELPIAPGVAAHSIIAAKDDRPPLDHAEDGVVAYKSAHLEGVESELCGALVRLVSGEPAHHHGGAPHPPSPPRDRRGGWRKPPPDT